VDGQELIVCSDPLEVLLHWQLTVDRLHPALLRAIVDPIEAKRCETAEMFQAVPMGAAFFSPMFLRKRPRSEDHSDGAKSTEAQKDEKPPRSGCAPSVLLYKCGGGSRGLACV
jgi:hypothetical protein